MANSQPVFNRLNANKQVSRYWCNLFRTARYLYVRRDMKLSSPSTALYTMKAGFLHSRKVKVVASSVIWYGSIFSAYVTTNRRHAAKIRVSMLSALWNFLLELSTKKSGTVQWHENVLGKFKNVSFRNTRSPFKREVRAENQTEQQEIIKKFQFASRDCPLFRNIRKMMFNSPMKIPQI